MWCDIMHFNFINWIDQRPVFPRTEESSHIKALQKKILSGYNLYYLSSTIIFFAQEWKVKMWISRNGNVTEEIGESAEKRGLYKFVAFVVERVQHQRQRIR